MQNQKLGVRYRSAGGDSILVGQVEEITDEGYIEEQIARGPRSELFGEEERLQRVKNRSLNNRA